MAKLFPWSVSTCQSTERGKTLFLKAVQAEPAQLLGWLLSHQHQNALDGLQDLSKPRDANALPENGVTMREQTH